MAAADRPVRAVAATALALGLATLAGGAAVRVAGGRVRRRSSPAIDDLAQLDVPVRHHDLDTLDGGRLHLVERLGPVGDDRTHAGAPPVLLLHGVALQWWVWTAQFHTIDDRHRVIAWDMRGHGASIPGHDGVTIEAVSDDLATVLVRLGLHDAVIVGHSMGGMALARFCADHHDVLHARVGALMFLGTSAATIGADTLIGAVVGAANVLSRLTGDGARMRYGWRDTDLSALLVRGVFGRNVSGRAVADVRRMLSETPPEAAAAAGRSIATHDVRAALDHVDVPTSVVVGTADRLTSVAHARVVADEVRGAELHVLEGVGHQVMQEAPVELAELIHELSARVRTGTPVPT